MDDVSDLPGVLPPPPKRGRGRPAGAKNKQPLLPQVIAGPRSVPPGQDPFDDYRHADPLTLVSRQYAMLDWSQQALRNAIKIGLGAESGLRVSATDVHTLMELSATMIRALDGHKKALAIAEELSKQKSPAELLEICVKRIMSQDLPTLQAIIRRLREHRAMLAPIAKRDEAMMNGVYKSTYDTAVSAVASLESEPDAVES